MKKSFIVQFTGEAINNGWILTTTNDAGQQNVFAFVGEGNEPVNAMIDLLLSIDAERKEEKQEEPPKPPPEFTVPTEEDEAL